MSTTTPTIDDGAQVADQYDETTRKALQEPLDVVADDPDTWGDDEVAVYSKGTQYIVNPRAGWCECPDHQYRGRECKHIKRARMSLALDTVPEWVQWDALDASLRRDLLRNDGGEQ